MVRRALLDKLFIGTDFPCFRRPASPAGGPGRPRGAYGHQARCTRDLFGDDLDEARMAENFLSLLPAEDDVQ